MKLYNLSPNEGANKKRKRLGRGIGSGLGKTCGKGHGGQNSRSGGGVRPGFEGGQMPLIRRVPKRGFSNARFKKVYSIVNIGDFEKFKEGTTIDINQLVENGVIRKKEAYGLKVLGNGNLTKKYVVKAKKFTKAAEEAITKCGGKAEII